MAEVKPPALRPWHWADRRPVAMALNISSTPKTTDATIGWAVLALPEGQLLDEGEHAFDPSSTEQQKIAIAVAQYRMLSKQYGKREVELCKYRPRSFHRSRAAEEGMTLEQHSKMVEDTRASLEKAGARVTIKIV